jgi:AcrR family transcriptional regulator
MNRTEKPLRISDLEKITGLDRGTIHYYLKMGLLSPPHRTGRTMAYYNSGHVRQIEEVLRLRSKGYPLASIREMMEGEPGAELATVIAPARGADYDSERRRQIMDKAVEIFARKGYHATRVTDITRAVGVGHSTFYIYFPNKKALFIECVDRVFQAMFSEVWEEIRHEADPLKRMRMRGEVVLKQHPQFIDILQVLRTAVEDDPRLETKRREIYSSIAETVKRDLDRAVQQGLLIDFDTALMSYLMVGLLETGALIIGLDLGYTVDELMDSMDKVINPSRLSSGKRD